MLTRRGAPACSLVLCGCWSRSGQAALQVWEDAGFRPRTGFYFISGYGLVNRLFFKPVFPKWIKVRRPEKSPAAACTSLRRAHCPETPRNQVSPSRRSARRSGPSPLRRSRLPASARASSPTRAAEGRFRQVPCGAPAYSAARRLRFPAGNRGAFRIRRGGSLEGIAGIVYLDGKNPDAGTRGTFSSFLQAARISCGWFLFCITALTTAVKAGAPRCISRAWRGAA